MTFTKNTIKAEGLGTSFKNLGRSSAKANKNLATKVLKKTQADLWRLAQILLLQPQLENTKVYYQHNLM